MTDRKESKEAILGELESIKDLLSEEELADIPVLEDAVFSTSNPSQLHTAQEQATEQNNARDDLEFPLLTSVDEDIPTLDEAIEKASETESIKSLEDEFDDIPLLDDISELNEATKASPDDSPTKDVDTETDIDFSAIDTDEAVPEEDYLLHGVDDILNEDIGDMDFSAKSDSIVTEHISESEFDLLSAPESELREAAALNSSELEDDVLKQDSDLPTSLFEDILQDAKEQGLDTSALDNFETFLEISEALESGDNLEPDRDLLNPELSSKLTDDADTLDSELFASLPDEETEQAPRDSSMSADSKSPFAIDNSNGLPEPLLAPNALPGQQSLFEISAQASLETTAEVDSSSQESDFSDFDEEKNDEDFTATESDLSSEPEIDLGELQGLDAIPDDMSLPPEESDSQDSTSEEVSTPSLLTSADTENTPLTDDIADPLADELDHLEESLAELTQDQTLAPHKPDAERRKPETELPKAAKGENPFLPKHIRDRLHTDRSLIDEIKNDPANTSNTAAKKILEPVLNQAAQDTATEYQGQAIDPQQLSEIISNVLHEQLPAIEQEIRRRLLESLSKNQPK